MRLSRKDLCFLHEFMGTMSTYTTIGETYEGDREIAMEYMDQFGEILNKLKITNTKINLNP